MAAFDDNVTNEAMSENTLTRCVIKYKSKRKKNFTSIEIFRLDCYFGKIICSFFPDFTFWWKTSHEIQAHRTRIQCDMHQRASSKWKRKISLGYFIRLIVFIEWNTKASFVSTTNNPRILSNVTDTTSCIVFRLPFKFNNFLSSFYEKQTLL